MAAGILINALGLLSPIIEPDGALYATIAKHMVRSGDYSNLIFQGNDWLDKPHFQFWVTAVSFHVFGVTTIGFKLPALLFWLLGIFYTYRFTRLFYSVTTAQLASLIYVSAFHLVLSNNDVRAEPYLTALIIAAVFHCYLGIKQADVKHILAGALFAAAAVMTKGIFVLIITFAGLTFHWILQKEFTRLVLYRLTGTILLAVLFTAPEIISLYYQFDLHPEKIVFGRQGFSGIRFFFWDSQFGRFFNTGPIKGEGDPFFFLHTTLWAFFPWSIAFFASLGAGMRRLFALPEKVTLITLVVTFSLFSFSKFQLPHYLNIVFPFMSILTAHYLVSLPIKFEKAWNIITISIIFVTVSSVIFLSHYSIPSLPWPVTVGITILLLASFFSVRFTLPNLSILALVTSFILYAFINLCFVPVLMRYQAGSEAAFFWRDHAPNVPIVMLNQDSSCSFDFYAPCDVRHLSLEELTHEPAKPFLFCHEKFIDSLKARNIRVDPVKSFPFYKVSQPSVKFMNYKTRDAFPERYVIVKLH